MREAVNRGRQGAHSGRWAGFSCPFVVHRGTEPVLDSSNELSKFAIQTYDLELQQSIDTGKF
jgi:hypothetical protein